MFSEKHASKGAKAKNERLKRGKIDSFAFGNVWRTPTPGDPMGRLVEMVGLGMDAEQRKMIVEKDLFPAIKEQLKAAGQEGDVDLDELIKLVETYLSGGTPPPPSYKR